MPFILITVGILMIVVAIRNTQTALGQQITADFTGPGNFFYWIAALFIVGCVGYIDALKGPSRAMLALILVSLILKNQGFFQKFAEQLKQGSAAPPPSGPTPPQQAGTNVGAGAVGGGAAGAAGKILGGQGPAIGGAAGGAIGGPAGSAVGTGVGAVLGKIFPGIF